jgi:DNA processing protein
VSAPGCGRAASACERCLRRAWLLAELSAPLDFLAGDRERLIGVLSLGDEQLLKAVAGRRRVALATEYARFSAGRPCADARIEQVCGHQASFPHALTGAWAPHLLYAASGARRLERLAAERVVAIVGSGRASDYGIEVAKSLARGLAAAGVTVAGALRDGIARAAHAGALEVEAGTIAVIQDGLGVGCPVRHQQLYRRIGQKGCAVSELPGNCRGRRWGALASERIVVGLAEATVVVEAEDSPRELAAARTAQALGRPVAALPGRVTSPRSTGTHVLLVEGAPLIRGVEAVLELLHQPADGDAVALAVAGRADGSLRLAPRLRGMLERVAAGCDTPERLTAEGADIQDVLLALTELELMGLLARGDGGRYVLRGTPAKRPSG